MKQPHRWPYLIEIGAIALAYFATAEFILSIPALWGQVSPVWPPAGIAMAALLLMGRSRWAGVAIGAFWIDISHGASLLEAVGTVSGSTLQAVVGVSLLQWVNLRPSLNRLRDVWRFVLLGAVLVTTISPTINGITLFLLGELSRSELRTFWLTFWLGDGMAVLVITSLILVWGSGFPRPLPPRQMAERLVWIGLLLVISWGIFHVPVRAEIAQYPIEYLPFPLLVWGALRFGQPLAVLGSFLVSSVAIWGALEGYGPFVAQASVTQNQPILLLQTFMGLVTVTTLLLASAVAERRDTEQRLRRSEASLANAQQVARLGNWDYDIFTQTWHWSDELYSLLGLVPEMVNPGLEALLAVVHPLDRERVQADLTEALIQQIPCQLDYRIVLPNGAERLISEQVAVCGHGLTGTVQDVTNQKEAEIALRESEERFSKAFGFSPDSISLSTLADGRFLEVNDSFLRLTGYRREEVIGRTSIDLNLWLTPDERDRVVGQMQQTGSIRNEEIVFRRKNGEMLITSTSLEIVPIQGEACLLCTARDITQQKLVQADLRFVAERDRLLGEIALHIRQSLHLGEILNSTVTEVRQFLRVGRVFITQFDADKQGIAVAESVAPEFSSVMGEETDECVYDEVQRMFQHAPVVVINDVRDIPASSFLNECVHRYQVKAAIGVPIMVDGRLYGVLVAHQCSDRREWQPLEIQLLERLATQVAIAIQQAELYHQVQRLNTSLEQQVAERTVELELRMRDLQELNTLLHFFFHAIAHDLSTTVKGMVMLWETLQEQADDSVQLSRCVLDKVVNAGKQHLAKLDALQEIYSIRQQGMALERQPKNFREVLERAIAHVTPLLEKNRATLMTDLPDTWPILRIDPCQVQRVLEQGLTNALQHNPPGVTVTVRVSVQADRLTCMIADNGVGMSQERCDRLFSLPVDCPESRQLKGMSLGLYLSWNIIRAHGGDIGVESQLHGGTTLWFTLPVTSPPHGGRSDGTLLSGDRRFPAPCSRDPQCG
ncbi:MAG: MASE1 domain-containing protein [Synechococcales bacterium]|nr:MASE1 domain-containing protein [Synechococcales bacterium]